MVLVLSSGVLVAASTDKLTSPLSTGCGRVVMPMTTLIEEHHRHDQYSADDDVGIDLFLFLSRLLLQPIVQDVVFLPP